MLHGMRPSESRMTEIVAHSSKRGNWMKSPPCTGVRVMSGEIHPVLYSTFAAIENMVKLL